MADTTLKTSIKVKKIWYATPAADGDYGTDWVEIQLGAREATVQFQGSDSDTTNYKNVLGSTLESSIIKGDKTMNFQNADLSPEVIAAFTGGLVTTDAEAIKFSAPENENQSIEKSIKFLTDKNILVTMPRVSFDAFPVFNDDDLHYYQLNSVVLQPTKAGLVSYEYYEILQPDTNDILTFVLAEQDAPAVITPGANTVAIDVAIATDPSTLTPVITTDLGSSITPGSDTEQDFSSPFVYSVESANGTKVNWTVTVTVLV